LNTFFQIPKLKKKTKITKRSQKIGVFDLFVESDLSDTPFSPSQKTASSSSSALNPNLITHVRNQHYEWDFRDIEPEERPMAVAWEYGRELKKTFAKHLKRTNGRPYGFFKSDLLHPVFLDFVNSPGWPSKPYGSLSPNEKLEAFPRAPWKLSVHQKKPSQPLVKEINISNPTGSSCQDLIHQALSPSGRRDPCRVLLAVDLGANSNLVLRDFKEFLSKKDLLLSAGRAPYERDLTALSVLRLHRFFSGSDYSKFYEQLLEKTIGMTEHKGSKGAPKSPFVSRANRSSYLRLAAARIGVPAHDLKDVQKFFVFFKFLGSFDA